MPIQFKFDVEDTLKVEGLRRPWDTDVPYLTPVFFNKEVLVRYFYDPRYMCEFASETYGYFYDLKNEFHIPFGINPNNKVVMWLGDIDKLPETEKNYLVSENIESDHDIKSEFYDAQINVQFTEPIREVEILLLKKKINEATKNNFGISIFSSEDKIEYDEVIEKCSRYKRISFQNRDDFKRFISDWNEILVEDIDHSAIKNYLKGKGIEFDKKIKSNKALEVFIKKVVGEERNIIAPFFYLYDLRIWSDHKDAESLFSDTITKIGLKKDVTDEEIYQSLINKIHEFLLTFLNLIQKNREYTSMPDSSDLKPTLSSLAFVGFYVNSAIANGHGNTVSFQEIYDNLEKGTLLEYLDQKIPGEFDFSLFPPGGKQCSALNHVLNNVAGGLHGRERRKVGIETSGLHLLMAFIIEAMQQQEWVIPNRKR